MLWRQQKAGSACSRVPSSVAAFSNFYGVVQMEDNHLIELRFQSENTVFKFLQRRVFFRVNKKIEMWIEIIKKASRAILLIMGGFESLEN